MATRIPPAHLMGAQTKVSVKRGVTRRLHNRRISMVVTPEGDYQLHTAKALAPGEAAELRAHGHRDSLKDYILRDRALFLMELIQRLLCSNAREAIIGSPAYA